jgi:hypothetical protein
MLFGQRGLLIHTLQAPVFLRNNNQPLLRKIGLYYWLAEFFLRRAIIYAFDYAKGHDRNIFIIICGSMVHSKL